jgi:hypothetical protein
MVFNYATTGAPRCWENALKRPPQSDQICYCKYNHYYFSFYSIEFGTKTLIYVMFVSDRERN